MNWCAYFKIYVPFVLIKGKFNYICLGRVKRTASSGLLRLRYHGQIAMTDELGNVLTKGTYFYKHMRQFRHYVALLLLLAVSPSLLAQKQRSQAFKDKYTLSEAVILSRHNIRAPLSTKGSLLEKVTTHPWFEWTSGASELTSRGGALENQFGLYFRKWAVDAGLFKENANPTKDEVNIYANSMQRCIATARYFTTAFLPVADISVNHRFVPSKMDPVFFPRLTKVSESFKKEALKQIAAMGGNRGIRGINEDLKKAYEITAATLDLKDSPACKSGQLCAFDN